MDGCILSTSSTINITCSVEGYFPSISLFYVHMTNNVTTQHSAEWDNSDGTRSKHITISAAISDDEYVCVASHIPGKDSNFNRTVTVRVVLQEGSTTFSTDTTTQITVGETGAGQESIALAVGEQYDL